MNLRSHFKRKQDLPTSNLMERIQGGRTPARYRKAGNQKTLTAKVVVITLEKIKEMCPKELTGINRAIWIDEKRKEYGI